MNKKLEESELVQARRSGRVLIFWVFLFSIIVNILMLTGPLFMLQVYDRVLGSRSEETLTALFILVAVLYLVMIILDYLRGRILARYAARFQDYLDERVFRAVLKRSLIPAERTSVATGPRDVEAIQNTISSPGIVALFDIPWVPLFFGAIFIFHPLLGWLGLSGGAVLITLAFSNQILSKRKILAAQSGSAKAHILSDQSRKAGEIIQAQGMTTSIIRRWRKLRETSQKDTISASDVSGFFTATTKGLRLFLQSAMLGAGAYLVLRGELTAGAMIAGSILLGRALAPIEQSLGQLPNLQRAYAGWVGLGRLLAETPDTKPQTPLPRPQAELKVQNLAIVPPGSRKSTVRDVSFTLKPGQALGVIGKSGAGKSSFARALVGLWMPANGEIRLGGARLDQYDAETLGTYIGYLPQDVSLFEGTIAENISRFVEGYDPEELVRAAKDAEAHDLILSLPSGYDTLIEGGNVQLSGGQRQRIALARALYGKPEIVVLDEPNSALDADGSNALGLAIKRMKQIGKSVIIMTHRPTAIAECDTLLVLNNGTVQALGPRDKILQAMVGNANAIKKDIALSGVKTPDNQYDKSK